MCVSAVFKLEPTNWTEVEASPLDFVRASSLESRVDSLFYWFTRTLHADTLSAVLNGKLNRSTHLCVQSRLQLLLSRVTWAMLREKSCACQASALFDLSFTIRLKFNIAHCRDFFSRTPLWRLSEDSESSLKSPEWRHTYTHDNTIYKTVYNNCTHSTHCCVANRAYVWASQKKLYKYNRQTGKPITK